MATISENLSKLTEAKENIKTAIEAKGQDLTNVPFSEYGNKIEQLQTGSGVNGLQWKCDNMKSLYMEFYNYTGESLDEALTGLDTSKVNNMQGICQNCANLTHVYFSNTHNVQTWVNAFNGCYVLDNLSLDVYSASSLSGLLGSCKEMKNLTLKNIRVNLQVAFGSVWGNKLTLDSLTNIIKELWDNSSSTSVKTLTMGTTNTAKIADVYVKLIDITDEMRAEDEYIDNKLPFVVCENSDEGAMTIIEYATRKNWAIA